jgi:hypothetical protein
MVVKVYRRQIGRLKALKWEQNCFNCISRSVRRRTAEEMCSSLGKA